MKSIFSQFSACADPASALPANDTKGPQAVRVALQGGGALGAYGAGALIGLLESDNIKIIEGSGTSAGAGNLYLANQKDKKRAIASIRSYWRDIGTVGDTLQFYSIINPIGSYLYSRWKMATAIDDSPLHYLNGALKRLKKPHHAGDMQTYINTVSKINASDDLHPANLIEHIHTDHVEAVTASGGLSALGGWALDGTVHWDGAYSGNNPPLECFDTTQQIPLVVISVDNKAPKQSPRDPHIQYGRIHQDISDMREAGQTVYHISLSDRGVVDDAVRMYPSANVINTLMDQGYHDALACLKKIEQDHNLIVSRQVTQDVNEQDYRAA